MILAKLKPKELLIKEGWYEEYHTLYHRNSITNICSEIREYTKNETLVLNKSLIYNNTWYSEKYNYNFSTKALVILSSKLARLLYE